MVQVRRKKMHWKFSPFTLFAINPPMLVWHTNATEFIFEKDCHYRSCRETKQVTHLAYMIQKKHVQQINLHIHSYPWTEGGRRRIVTPNHDSIRLHTSLLRYPLLRPEVFGLVIV